MSKFFQSKPFSTLSSIHVNDEQLIIEFLNINSKSFGAIKYLGSFIDDLKIRNEIGIKAKNDFLLVERESYNGESPGNDIQKKDGNTPAIFEFSYELPDEFPKAPTEKQKYIMLNTVETYSCNPRERCSKCNGSGICASCDGRGYNRCGSCSGNGKREVRNGSYANGKPKYKQVSCSSCHGSGKRSCSSCSGSKKCYRCDGSGKVTCSRCNGTSNYQTYLGYSTFFKSTTAVTNYSVYPELLSVIPKTNNKTSYDDDLIEWEDVNNILFDNRNTVLNINKHSTAFINSLESLGGLTSNDKIGRVHSSFETVPITVLDFKFEENDYTLYIVGEDNIICYNEIPKKHSYRPSIFTRILNFFTKKKRQIAFLHIASFIFNADDYLDEKEANMFDSFLNKVKINQTDRAHLIEKLKVKSDLDSILPFIKPIRKDKRALVFAWHCVMQDNLINEKEIIAFNELGLYFNLTETEVEMIKHKAKQFSGLSIEQMLEEYFK